MIGLPVTQRGSLRKPHTDSQQGRRCRNFALNVAALGQSAGMDVFLVGRLWGEQRGIPFLQFSC